jgi:vacuolar-type H+-ATPase subunit E/Vma4
MSNLPNDRELLAYFEQQIKKEGQKDLQQLTAKINEDIAQKKQEIELQLSTKYELKLSLMQAELKHQFDQQIRDYETQVRQDYGQKRSNNIQSIFKQVETQLHEFVSSNEYGVWLEEIYSNFKDRTLKSSAIITIKHHDHIAKKLFDPFLKTITLIEDTSIQWGGFFLQFTEEKFRYDFTLDNRWKDAKKRYFDKGNPQ